MCVWGEGYLRKPLITSGAVMESLAVGFPATHTSRQPFPARDMNRLVCLVSTATGTAWPGLEDIHHGKNP